MLKDMKVADLKALAEEYGVELVDAKTKAQILARLDEEGVNESLLGAEPEPAPKEESGDQILVKMERENPTYEILGYTFTLDHPYVSINESDAQKIFDHDPRGFKVATPREVKEYYS